MICPICGRNIENENAHFCDNCGASLRGVQQGMPMNQSGYGVPPIQNVGQAPYSEAPISFGNWLGTLCLPYIPIVGSIVYLVMLVVWSVSGKTNPTKKNWARASLLVNVVVTILLFMFAGTIMEMLGLQL